MLAISSFGVVPLADSIDGEGDAARQLDPLRQDRHQGVV